MTSYACLASELLALRRRQKVCGWQARKFLFPSEFNSEAKTRNWVNLVSHKTHIYYWTWRLGKQFIIIISQKKFFLRILVLQLFKSSWKSWGIHILNWVFQMDNCIFQCGLNFVNLNCHLVVKLVWPQWPQWWSFEGKEQLGIYFWSNIFQMGHQKVHKSDFQSKFSMSKNFNFRNTL